MGGKYRETDYLYASARVRALEGKIAGADALGRMTDARSPMEVMGMLPDYGFELIYRDGGGKGALLREETLATALIAGYNEVSELAGDAKIAAFLQYPYDCNNIKAVIKCRSRGISPEGMLIGFSSVPAQKVPELLRDEDYTPFPRHMREAIPEAIRAFAESGNPQKVDLILDRACYADMLEQSESGGCAFAAELVRSKIDLTNFLICLRLCRMNLQSAGLPLLKEALIPGGTLPAERFCEAYEGGEEKLAEMFSRDPKYSSLAALAGSNTALSVAEKRVDNFWLAQAKRARYVSFGAEALIGYLVALEYEVKNIRMILAGKDAGLPREVIRERLRDCYV